MQKHTKLAAMILILTMSLSLPAMAKRGRSHRRGKRRSIHGIFMRVLNNPGTLKELGISESKAQRIRTILYNKKKQLIPVFAKIKIDRLNIRQEYEKNTVSRNRILRIYKRMHNNRWLINKIGIKAKIRVLNMLTVKQRQQLKTMGRRNFRKFNRKSGRRYKKNYR